MSFNPDLFLDSFNSLGHAEIENVLDSNFILKAKSELIDCLKADIDYMGTEDYPFYGYVLSNAKYGGSFWDLFDNKLLINAMNLILGENCIVYSYTSSSMPPNAGNHSSQIHVDCPIFLENYNLRLGVIIPLTDFTSENGATYFLEKSQLKEEKPSEELFYKKSKRLIINKGSAWFFNTRLWHAGGINKTQEWRHAITINLCRPWMKQYFDIPKLIAHQDLSSASDTLLQKFGFHSQPPCSYDEYFDKTKKKLFI